MSRTRRDFFRTGALAGAAVFASACSTRVGGVPHAGATLTSPPSSTGGGGGIPRPVSIGVVEYRPYAYSDYGEFTGEVPEIARAVLAKLGDDEVRFVLLPFDALIPALESEQVDIIGGLGITPERCAQVAFVPDHVANTALLVPKGNPKKLKTFAEVTATGARVALLSGTIEADHATAAEVPESQQVQVPTVEFLMQTVIEGRADCGAYDDITLRYQLATSDNGAALEVLSGFTMRDVPPWVGAFGFRQSDTDRRDEFDDALRDLRESGEWLRIAEKYSFTDSNLPGPDVTTEKACTGR